MKPKMQKTSFKVTKSLQELEELILSNMDIPRTAFHRRMIDNFLRKEDKRLDPRLYITKRSDPGYIRMDVLEQIYLDENRYNQIGELAEQMGSNRSRVLFQMLMDYCVEMAPLVLGDADRYIVKKEEQN